MSYDVLNAELQEVRKMGRRLAFLLRLAGIVLLVSRSAWAAEGAGTGTPNSTDLAVVGLWILANISFAGMRAQNSPRQNWRTIAFIFGFPGTLVSFLAVREGSERAYGIDIRRGSEGRSFQETKEPDMSSRRDKVLAWLATGLFCLYCVWTFVSLDHNIRGLVRLYPLMGSYLPISTRFIIASRPALYLCILGGGGIFVGIKEFLVHDKKRSLTITLITALLVVLAVDWANTALLLPLVGTIDKRMG